MLPPLLSALPAVAASIDKRPAGTGSLKVTSGSATLQVTAWADRTSEAVVDAGGQRLRLTADAAKGAAVVEDSGTSTRTVYETGPKGTLVRTFDGQSKFIAGFWIEGRALYRMKIDGSTQPTNLVYLRALAAAPPKPVAASAGAAALELAAAAPSSRALAAGSSDSCYAIIQSLTGSGAEYASTIGDAYEESDSEPAKRAGRAAHFLSRLWSRAASLCPDAPDPLTDAEYQRAAWLDAVGAISGGRISDAIDKYRSWQDYLDAAQARAKLLQDAITRLPDSIRTRFGTAAPRDDDSLGGGVNASPASEIAKRAADAPKTAIYINGSLGCANVQSRSGGFTLANRCSEPVRIGYCFNSSQTAACAISVVAALAVGASTAVTASSGTTSIWYGACQSAYAGHAVAISDGAGNTFYCSYRSGE